MRLRASASVLGTLFSAASLAAAADPPTFASLPLRFEPNLGQLDRSVDFVARMPGGQVRVHDGAFTLVAIDRDGRAAAVEVGLIGGVASVPQGTERLPGVSHHFHGDRRITDVPGYARLRCPEVRPGIDLVLRGAGSQLEFDLEVAAGAARDDLALRLAGARSLELEPDGALRIETAAGPMRLLAPVSFQEIAGERVIVASSYRLLDEGVVAFELGEHRRDLPLVIDPVVVNATYLGGTGYDAVFDIAVDAAGDVYVTGQTSSTNFPIVNALQPSITPFHDVFVAKFDATLSSLHWATYLGGTAPYTDKEAGLSLVLDASASVYVLGTTTASDFPTTNAFQPNAGGGGGDAVLFGLTSAGDTLLFSTYLGGSGEEIPAELAIDSSGSLFAVGATESTDFPTVSALQSALLGGSDAFVASFDLSGSVRFATYLGGVNWDVGLTVQTDAAGNVLLGGAAQSGFPTTPGAFATAGVGFVTRMDNFGTTLIASTMFAGAPTGIGTDASDRVYVAGTTSSFSFPTTFGAWQTEHGGSYDSHFLQIFVAAFTPDLGQELFGTYYGDFAMNETAHDLVVDPSGEVIVAGTASEHTGTNTERGLLLKLSADLSALAWDKWVGGSSEELFAVFRDAAGVLHVCGESWGSLGPTSGAFQTSYRGSADGFVAQLTSPASTLTQLTLQTTKAITGDVIRGTVAIDGDAPAGGIAVSLTSSDPSVASVPSVVVIPAGRSTEQFQVTTAPGLPAPSLVTITATWGATISRDLLVWLGPSWRIDFLGTLIGAESCAKGIASTSRIAGRSRGADIYFHVVRTTNGALEDLGQGEGSDINDSGQVSATFGTAMRFTDGVGWEDLGTFKNGFQSEARGINNLGQVVGWSDGGTIQQHAFRFTDGVGMKDLGTLGGALSEAEDVNDAGQVVGSSYKTGNTAWRAFRFTDGSGMQDLGVLPGFAHSYGHSINELGDVAGTLFDSSYSAPHAFRYTDGAGMTDLGTLPGETFSRAGGIDNAGRVTGLSGQRVFLWTDGIGMVDVTDGIAPENLFGWEILEVNAMNDRGTIVGCGFFLGNGRQESAFRIVRCDARWNSYGAGWPGQIGVPTLLPSNDPELGKSITVTMSNSYGTDTPGIMLLGFAPASFPTRTGTVLVDVAIVAPLFIPALGLSVSDVLPNDPLLCDVGVYLQVLEADPWAIGKISFTPGLELILGY